jgi:hypothetical protein
MPFDNPNHGPYGHIEILLDARARISDGNRWLKGDFQKGDRHCLVAALALACDNRAFQSPTKAERKLCRVLVQQLPREGNLWRHMICIAPRQRLMAFNDSPRTRHDDVMGLFDRAILHLESKTPLGVR